MAHSPQPNSFPPEKPLATLTRKGVLIIAGVFIAAWIILQMRVSG